MKKITATIVILCFLLVPAFANAFVPYDSYTYSYFETSRYLPSPAPYIPVSRMDFSDQGITLDDPQDMFVRDDGITYIADTGNDRILVFDHDWKIIQEIDSFENNGMQDTFDSPRGIYIREESLYIADTQNNRIIELDLDGSLIREIGPPRADVIPAGFIFQPTKLAVSASRRIYVVARNVFEGLIELDNEGNFFAYTGSNLVSYNPIELFWRRILTREQIEQMTLFIPVEYTNLSICSRGFIFTVSAAGQTESPIKRLNAAGVDVLQWDGYIRPMGDQTYNTTGSSSGPSTLIDIDIDDNGIYRVLDSNRGRIFTYNPRGNLLFAFGGIGGQMGMFSSPSAIASRDKEVFVLDSRTGTVTVFEPTLFGEKVIEGVILYQNGRYDESNRAWKEVLSHNTNYELAYINIGRAQLRQGEYTLAMENFKLGYDRDYYSRAFRRYRNIVIKQYFPVTATVAGVLLIGYLIYRMAKKKLAELKKEI